MSDAPSTVDWMTLPSGRHRHRFGTSDLGFDAWIWRGAPGPVLIVNGATHGDEFEGPTLLRRWIDSWRPRDLQGTVVLIPVLNEAAFAAEQRCHPTDEGNLARAFPGDVDGPPTARLAHLFDTQILAHATHYVDLHSGGKALELHPWVGYISGSDLEATQRKMAACFDQFGCWAGPYLPGRTLSAAFTRNIAAIYTECRGAGDVRPADLAALEQGLQNLLREIGCIRDVQPTLVPQAFHLSVDAEDTHLQVHHPAPAAGTFEAHAAPGESVTTDQKIGVIRPTTQGTAIPILANRSGTIVLRRHLPDVQPGDALFVIIPF